MIGYKTSLIYLALAVLSKSSDAFTPTSMPRQSNTNLKMSSEANNLNKSTRRDILTSITAGVVATTLTQFPQVSQARLDPVNRPDLLPDEAGQNVIQIEKFLTSGQVKRMNDQLTRLEKDTGFRVRVLCQAYPKTPGLAIRDYWDLGKEGQKDDKYIVLVVDQFGGKGKL